MLRAGIDVITTLNVQHLEGLADSVRRRTGAIVRETLPDGILSLADEIVSIDITPEALRQRLREGRIYPPERIDSALENFFRTEHLVELRELALREALHGRYRDSVPSPFDRIVLSLGPNSLEIPLIARAGRLAARLSIEFTIVHITDPKNPPDPVVVAAVRADTRKTNVEWIEEAHADAPRRVIEIARARSGNHRRRCGHPAQTRIVRAQDVCATAVGCGRVGVADTRSRERRTLTPLRPLALCGFVVLLATGGCGHRTPYELSSQDKQRFVDVVRIDRGPAKAPLIFGMNDCTVYRADTDNEQISGWRVVCVRIGGRRPIPNFSRAASTKACSYGANTLWSICAPGRLVPAVAVTAAAAIAAATAKRGRYSTTRRVGCRFRSNYIRQRATEAYGPLLAEGSNPCSAFGITSISLGCQRNTYGTSPVSLR